MPLVLPALYPIIDTEISPHPVEILIEEFAAAGLTWVQLRDKKANSRELFKEAQRLVELASVHQMKVIVNDRSDISWLANADGAHLGQEDLPIEDARRILGWGKIIGVSAHNLKQAVQAEESSADYVAIGPVFVTSSKRNPDPVLTRDELMEIRRQVTKPLVAIGGITTENAGTLFGLGFDSVAVIRDLLCVMDISSQIQRYLKCHDKFS